MIKMQNVKKEYHSDSVITPVLKGVNFEIKEAEFVAIVGASGSGKSTLLNMIGLLDTPTSGDYYLDSKNVSELKRAEAAHIRNKKIGFVFQRYNLLPRTSVLENVLLPTIYNPNLKRKIAEDRAKSLIEKVGLSHRIDNTPSQLSGGESQRVAIARALINNPAIILADEPTGNLGYEHTEPVMNIFKDLNSDGNTIIMVTHSKEISDYAERKIHLEKGIIRESPPKDRINNSSKH